MSKELFRDKSHEFLSVPFPEADWCPHVFVVIVTETVFVFVIYVVTFTIIFHATASTLLQSCISRKIVDIDKQSSMTIKIPEA